MRRVLVFVGLTLLVGVLPASAALLQETDPPVITCDSADGQWHAADVSIACTATDSGSWLVDPADASFTLTTSVPAGQETVDAMTDTREVCDVDGNCATAGPIAGNMVDLKAPDNPLTVHSTDHKVRKWSRDRRITMSWTSGADGGSGVDGFSFSFNHQSSSLPDAAKDNEQTERKATSARLRTGKWWFHLRTADNVANWAGVVNRGPYFIDITRPQVRARSASGKVGHRMTLRYQTGDITLRRSGSLVKAWSRRMGRAFFSQIQTVSLTPHAAGSYSFCVKAWDPAGNSRKDCAGITVKNPQPSGGDGGGRCDPSYPDFCIPPLPPDLDCSDISQNNFTVKPPDPHNFDSDGDGVGCET
jgi:hypothetical protein